MRNYYVYTAEKYSLYVCENNAIKNVIILEKKDEMKYIVVNWDVEDDYVLHVKNCFLNGKLYYNDIFVDEFQTGNFREHYNSFEWLA